MTAQKITADEFKNEKQFNIDDNQLLFEDMIEQEQFLKTFKE